MWTLRDSAPQIIGHQVLAYSLHQQTCTQRFAGVGGWGPYHYPWRVGCMGGGGKQCQNHNKPIDCGKSCGKFEVPPRPPWCTCARANCGAVCRCHFSLRQARSHDRPAVHNIIGSVAHGSGGLNHSTRDFPPCLLASKGHIGYAALCEGPCGPGECDALAVDGSSLSGVRIVARRLRKVSFSFLKTGAQLFALRFVWTCFVCFC